MVDAAEAFGLKAEIEVQPDFEVWPENLEALNVFLSCQDDWKPIEKRRYGTIDKSAMKAIMEMIGVENMKETFADLIAMQDAAVKAIYG